MEQICKNCKFWEHTQVDLNTWGVCQLANGVNYGMAVVKNTMAFAVTDPSKDRYGDAYLKTDEEFGCNQFEEKTI